MRLRVSVLIRNLFQQSGVSLKQKKAGRPAIIYSKHYDLDLGGLENDYPFDVHKFARIHAALLQDGPPTKADLLEPEPAMDAELLAVHTPGYLLTLSDPTRLAEALEYPPLLRLDADFLDRTVIRMFRYATGGTILACREALKRGLAINLSGGFHHAQPEMGAGFCLLADVAVAIKNILRDGGIAKAIIVDCDLHQGDGNAVIFRDDSSVFTFSIHQEDTYPEPKMSSSLDVGLWAADGIDDAAYMEQLESHIPRLFDEFKPDLAVFLAGSDVFREDFLGGFQLSAEGIAWRDGYVVASARSRNVPLCMVLAGGYSAGSWQIHYESIRNILRSWK